MSDYVFVLHAHVPTTLQLQEVSDRRKQDQEWKDWLLKMSGPFTVQFIIQSERIIGVLRHKCFCYK